MNQLGNFDHSGGRNIWWGSFHPFLFIPAFLYSWGGSTRMAISIAKPRNHALRRDKHLRSKDFFLADEHPSITFAVAKLAPAADGVTVEGSLTVRGRTNPVTFTASPAPVADGAVALDATVEVDRSHYGLTWNQLGMSSMHNTITLHAVFTRD